MDSTFNLRIAYLINGFIRDRLTIAEHEELDEWVCQSFINQQSFEVLYRRKFLSNHKLSLRLNYRSNRHNCR